MVREICKDEAFLAQKAEPATADDLAVAQDLLDTLTAQLRDMEEKGLLNRKVYAEVPPRVEYTLTDTGYSLKSVLDAMWAWGTDYKAKNG